MLELLEIAFIAKQMTMNCPEKRVEQIEAGRLKHFDVPVSAFTRIAKEKIANDVSNNRTVSCSAEKQRRISETLTWQTLKSECESGIC